MDYFTTLLMNEWEVNRTHLIIEALFLVFLAYFIPQKVYFQKRMVRNLMRERLTTKEVDQLCHEWVPEPLVPVDQATRVYSLPEDGTVVSAYVSSILSFPFSFHFLTLRLPN